MVVHESGLDQDLLLDLEDLHDDTEEDLVGADWHQTAIRVVNEGLLLAGPERGLPWHIGNQLTTLMGRVGSKDWNPSPDIAVHPTAGPTPMASFDTRVHGAPPLVIEVASEGTYKYDLGTKRRTYGRVGVREYLLFDPTQAYLGMAVRAWHARPHGFVPWHAERDGRWHSQALGVSFLPEGLLLRVFDADGQKLLHTSEQERRDAERRRVIAEQERRAQEQEQSLADLTRRLAELEAENRRLRGEPE